MRNAPARAELSILGVVGIAQALDNIASSIDRMTLTR
jgi:hypothetical protein